MTNKIRVVGLNSNRFHMNVEKTYCFPVWK